MTAEVFRLAFLSASSELGRIGRRQSELRMELRSLEERAVVCTKIKDGLALRICGSCQGHGHVQVWHAQDDVKSETCKACGGSGLPKGE